MVRLFVFAALVGVTFAQPPTPPTNSPTAPTAAPSDAPTANPTPDDGAGGIGTRYPTPTPRGMYSSPGPEPTPSPPAPTSSPTPTPTGTDAVDRDIHVFSSQKECVKAQMNRWRAAGYRWDWCRQTSDNYKPIYCSCAPGRGGSYTTEPKPTPPPYP